MPSDPKDPGPTAVPVQSWRWARFTGPASAAEAFAELVTRLSGLGVGEEDVPGGAVTVTGYLAIDAELEGRMAQVEDLAARLRQLHPGEEIALEWGRLEREDWHKAWKEHFHPLEAAPGLWIAPPWEPQAPGPGAVVIIDPGQAFGTGHHQSTALVLLRLSQLAREGALPGRVLDVGCGTGILSLAALALGAASALALDLDPLALEATEHNAALNRMTGLIAAVDTPVGRLEEAFPLVLANITALDLQVLAPALAARLAPGGELVAAGVMDRQADGVVQAMAQEGLKLHWRGDQDEWCALGFGR